jgi:class II lanthipeptide synthase
MLVGIAEYGWSCGLPLSSQTPGLMVGLAGLGYGLLRAADPGHVPSVLTLQAKQPEEVITPIPGAQEGPRRDLAVGRSPAAQAHERN